MDTNLYDKTLMSLQDALFGVISISNSIESRSDHDKRELAAKVMLGIKPTMSKILRDTNMDDLEFQAYILLFVIGRLNAVQKIVESADTTKIIEKEAFLENGRRFLEVFR